MSLRMRINVLIGAMMALFLAAFVYLEVSAVRRSVADENEGQHRVALHLISAIANRPSGATLWDMAEFMHKLGRVRGSEVVLFDAGGQKLYASPASPYKAGRDAPAWFSAIVAPPEQTTVFPLDGGRMVVSANPSRAILDGWDLLIRLLGIGAVLFAMVNALVYWLVGRALQPLDRVVQALRRIEDGDMDARLPALSGREAMLMGHAFNRMAEAMADRIAAREAASDAVRRLAENRELSRLVQSHVEEERRAIARELHDDTAQAVTAIRSLALTIEQRVDPADETSLRAAAMVKETAVGIQESINRLIHRLRPPALDTLGLADALGDLLDDWKVQRPDIAFALEIMDIPAVLPEEIAITAYRLAQEALTNMVRHSDGKKVTVRAEVRAGFLDIVAEDDGKGLPAEPEKPGHYGLRGMRERVEACGVTLLLAQRPDGGARIAAHLPLGDGQADIS